MLPLLQNGHMAITFDADVAQESASYQSYVVFLRAVQRYQSGRSSFNSFFFAHVEVSVMHAANPST